jgi:hypothetical protein
MGKRYKVSSREVKLALEDFEGREYYNTGFSHVNGGFCEAEIFDYDEEFFDIELKYGEQDMGGGRSCVYTEQFKMDRYTLEITEV